MPHPNKTLIADPVVYYPKDSTQGHVAFVIKTHDDDPHMACLVYYCPDTHAWLEAYNVPFGQKTGTAYFVNQGS